MITIRQAVAADITRIEELYKNKINQLERRGVQQWSFSDVEWSTLSQQYTINDFYLAFVDGKALGCFIIVDFDPTYWTHDKAKEALYIHKLMVDESVRKSGMSDAILTFFKEEGRRRGYPVVKLDVRAHKEKLRSFYERNGFMMVEIVDLNKGYLTALYEYRL